LRLAHGAWLQKRECGREQREARGEEREVEEERRRRWVEWEEVAAARVARGVKGSVRELNCQ
jgi:hypothetical protein